MEESPVTVDEKGKCTQEQALVNNNNDTGGKENIVNRTLVKEDNNMKTSNTNTKPDLNTECNPESSEDRDDDDLVVLPARSMEKVAKDDLLLTLGGSWGSNKEPTKEKMQGKSLTAGAAADISLSLGSSQNQMKATSMSIRTMSNTSTVSKSFLHNPSCSLTHNSFEELNSSATQHISNDNETVSHGGLFAHLAKPLENCQGQGSLRSSSIMDNPNPPKWNSYNLEKYQALFPDLKEGFRMKYGGTRRSKHNRGDERSESRIGLYEIAADSIPTVAHKLQELPDIFLEDLKKSLIELLSSVDKRDEFLRLQKMLQRRNDLSSETLYLAHRTQLEILVAMKTGIQAFVLRENPLPTSALVEIFLQKRCRNFACQNQLPADDCDCQFCSQKEGFCNACMCIACSKFDFMSNTCRWVGCDFCLHWCHTDCGIRLSYIKPGQSVQVRDGQVGQSVQSEMQFNCVACGHSSDLFGFVREVFTTYSKEWSPDVLRQELDCIQRIFRKSQDMRGKQLCWISERMLGKVEGCNNTLEICDTLIRFFQDGKVDLEKVNGKQKPAKEPGFITEDMSKMMKKVEHHSMAQQELEYSRARKRTEIEEMESLIHIKQAEAKMFQLRADEARLEAERLRKIVVAKSGKIEEEYVAKGYRLHVNEAIEKRKRSFVEYQMLEQGLQDFNCMKAKLVTDVHDVLKKMDAVKRTRFNI